MSSTNTRTTRTRSGEHHNKEADVIDVESNGENILTALGSTSCATNRISNNNNNAPLLRDGAAQQQQDSNHDPSHSVPRAATMQGLAAIPPQGNAPAFPIALVPIPVPVFAFGTMSTGAGDVDPSSTTTTTNITTPPDAMQQQAAMFANMMFSQQMAAMYHHQYVANLQQQQQQQIPQMAGASFVAGNNNNNNNKNTAALPPSVPDDNGGPNDESTLPGKILAIEQDQHEISTYQCLVRQQIEVFEQSLVDTTENMQGRNKPVFPGQVGIRCIHCGRKSLYRSRAAILFPTTLIGLYQTAQNMANTHLLQTCRLIPPQTRKAISEARSREKGKKTCKSSYGGGRRYWADSLTVLGVVEIPGRGLRFGDTSSRGNRMQRSVNNTGYEEKDDYSTKGKGKKGE